MKSQCRWFVWLAVVVVVLASRSPEDAIVNDPAALAVFRITVDLRSGEEQPVIKKYSNAKWLNSLLSNDWRTMAFSTSPLHGAESDLFVAPKIDLTLRVNRRRPSADSLVTAQCLGAADGFASFTLASMAAQSTLQPHIAALQNGTLGRQLKIQTNISVFWAFVSGEVQRVINAAQDDAIRANWKGFVQGHRMAGARLEKRPLSDGELFLVALGDETVYYYLALVVKFAVVTTKGTDIDKDDLAAALEIHAKNVTRFASVQETTIGAVDSSSGIILMNRVGFLGAPPLVWKTIQGVKTSATLLAKPGAFLACSAGLTVATANMVVIQSFLARDASALVQQFMTALRGELTAAQLPLPFTFVQSALLLSQGASTNPNDFVSSLASEATFAKPVLPVAAVALVACGPRKSAEWAQDAFYCNDLVFVQRETPSDDGTQWYDPSTVADSSGEVHVQKKDERAFVIGPGAVSDSRSVEDLLGGWRHTGDSFFPRLSNLRAETLRIALARGGVSPADSSLLMEAAEATSTTILTSTTPVSLQQSPWCRGDNQAHPTCSSLVDSPSAIAPRYDRLPEDRPDMTQLAKGHREFASSFTTPLPAATVFSAMVSLPDAVQMRLPHGAIRCLTLHGMPGDEALNRTTIGRRFGLPLAWQRVPIADAIWASSQTETELPVDGRMTSADLQTPVWVIVLVFVTGVAAMLVVTSFAFYDPTPPSRKSSILEARDRSYADADSLAVPLVTIDDNNNNRAAERRRSLAGTPVTDYGACTPRHRREAARPLEGAT